MAQLSTAQLLQLFNDSQPDNQSGEISAIDTRDPSKSLAESVFNKITDADLVGLRTYTSGRPYVVGETATHDDGGGSKLYECITNTSGAFNPSHWLEVGSAGSGDTITLGAAQNGLTLTGVGAKVLQLALSSTSTVGALSSADWNTFNGKQNALGFTAEDTANKGSANGYTPLNGSGKIDNSYLDAGIIGSVTYKGSWSAATNTPTLADGAFQGDYYVCNAAGSVDFGSGSIAFSIGDWVINNGTIWERLANSSGDVNSVQGLTGTVSIGNGALDNLVVWTGANTFKDTGIKTNGSFIGVDNPATVDLPLTIKYANTGINATQIGDSQYIIDVVNGTTTSYTLKDIVTGDITAAILGALSVGASSSEKYSALFSGNGNKAQIKLDLSGNAFIPSGGTDDGSLWADASGLYYRDSGATVNLLAVSEDVPQQTVSVLDPMVFDKDRTFIVNQTGNLNFSLGTGHATGKMIYHEYIIKGDLVNNITDSLTNIDLQGDTFNATKKNYVTVIWDGESVSKFSNQISELPGAFAIVNAVVTDANADQTQITFNATPTAGTMTGFTMDGDFADITIGAILTQVANVWTVQLSRSVLDTEEGSLVWASSDIEDSGEFLVDGSRVVDNQVSSPVANPVYVSSEIGNIDDQTLTITVDTSSNYDILGISLNASGGPLSVVANTAGDGTVTGRYSLSRIVAFDETVDITAAASNGIVNVIDGITMMTAITSQTVVNNVEGFEALFDGSSVATYFDKVEQATVFTESAGDLIISSINNGTTYRADENRLKSKSAYNVNLLDGETARLEITGFDWNAPTTANTDNYWLGIGSSNEYSLLGASSAYPASFFNIWDFTANSGITSGVTTGYTKGEDIRLQYTYDAATPADSFITFYKYNGATWDLIDSIQYDLGNSINVVIGTIENDVNEGNGAFMNSVKLEKI